MEQLPENALKVKTASITFDCPECGKQVNFQEAFTEEKLDGDIERVSLICPYCDSVEVGYYSNKRIRQNIQKLKQLRERANDNLDNGLPAQYRELQQKHIKYFDKFQKAMGDKRG